MAVQSSVAECCRAGTPLASFVERVEKPTDNRAAQSLCYLAADADSLGDRPVVGPSASPTPPPRLGPTRIRRKSAGPVLRGSRNGIGTPKQNPSFPKRAS